MRKLILISCFSLFAGLVWGQVSEVEKTNGWKSFAKVKFESTYMEKENQYLLKPIFDQRIKALAGQTISLTGYVMPFDYGDEPFIILSKYPFSQCFFCGAAGPESVAEIWFNSAPPKFKKDAYITIKGKLELNDTDIEHMNFMIKSATWEKAAH